MRSLLYILVLSAALLVPAQRSDVGNLIPVEVLCLCKDEQKISVYTDTGNSGCGRTAQEAFEDMEKHASGDIYPDTAEYVIVMGDDGSLTRWLQANMSGRVRICAGEGPLELADAAAYLSVHSPRHRLRDVDERSELQVFRQETTGFSLA